MTFHAITWEEITRIEPELQNLLEEAKAVKAENDNFCANKVWVREFKLRLVKLVGYEAKLKSLQNKEAYDLAYDKIYKELPDCRNCSCL